MIPYLALLTVPSVLSFAREGRRWKTLAVGGLVLMAFVGLRDEVGADWFGYDVLHQYLAHEDLSSAVSRVEALSFLVFWCSANLMGGMVASNLIAAAVLLAGVFLLAARTPNLWLGVVAATPYLVIVFGMSGLRQAMAVGTVLTAIAFWTRLGIYQRLLAVAIATTFHASAMATLILVVVELRLSIVRRVAIVTVVAAAAAIALQRSSGFSAALDVYESRYLDSGGGIISSGSLLHLSLLALPAIFGLIFRRRLRAHLETPRLLDVGIAGTALLVVLNFVSSTAASRLSLYLYYVPILVYGALARSLGYQTRANAVNTGILALHYASLVVWLSFANNAAPYLPYRNLLFPE